MKKFTPLLPGQQLSASEYNRMGNAVVQQNKMTVEPPLELVPNGTGFHLRCLLPGFWVQITNASSPYSWQEVQPNGNGEFVVIGGGRTGVTNAYEWNNNPTPENAYVWLVQTNDSEFWFVYAPQIPLYPGGTTDFLRADGTWAAPSGGGGLETYQSATLASNTNNFALSTGTNNVFLQLTASSNLNLTGLSGGTQGQMVEINNVSTFNFITLVWDSSSSSSGNRFLFSNGINQILFPGGTVVLKYDGTWWRDIAQNIKQTSTYIPPGSGQQIVYLTSDNTVSGTGLTTLTDLTISFPESGAWGGKVCFFVNNGTAASGFKFALSTFATPNSYAVGWPAKNGCTQGTRYTTTVTTPLTMTALPDTSDICVQADMYLNVASALDSYTVEVASNSGSSILTARKGCYWEMNKTAN